MIAKLFIITFVFLLAIILPYQSVQAINKQENYQKRTSQKFLDDVESSNESIIKLKSGMLIEVLATGAADAKSPTVSDQCSVTYKGTFKNGEQFDAGTTKFAPNQVIKGWTEAMQLMGEGDKWKLYIPYTLAYG